MNKKRFKTVEEYISSFPEEIQLILNKMRAAVRKSAPGAEEIISYNMPAYKVNKRLLIYFAGHTHHLGFYPMTTGIKKFKKQLSKYESAKGSVQFPYDKPLPTDLIGRIVKFRVKENLNRK